MSFLGWGRHDNAVAPLTYTKMQLPGQPEQSAADRTEYFPTMAKAIQPLLNDPAAVAAIQQLTQAGEQSSAGQAALQTLKARQKALGVDLPAHTNWAVTPDGRIGFQKTDILGDYIYPIATVVAAAGLGAGLLAGTGALGSAAASAAAPGGTAAGAAAPAAALGGSTAATGATAGLSFGSTVLGGGTAAGAAGAAGAAVPVAGGALTSSLFGTGITGMDLAKMGLSVADQAYQNKQIEKDRKAALSMAQVNEVQGAETAQQQRARLVLDQQQAERDAMAFNFSKALQGALAKNAEDVTPIDRTQFHANVPNISFGNSPRPSQIGDTGRANGALLESLATRGLTNPEPRTVLPPIERIAVLPGYVPGQGMPVPTAGTQGGGARLLTPEEQLAQATARGGGAFG